MKIHFINKIVILNLIVSITLIYVVMKFQQYHILNTHENYLPFVPINTWANVGRIPAALLGYININFLPKILNIHTQDYISTIGALIKAFLFFIVCFAASLGFYLNSRKPYSVLKNIESLIILPFVFFIYSIPLINSGSIFRQNYFSDNLALYFCEIRDMMRFSEYFVCLFFYFLFFISLIYILLNKDKNPPPQTKILIGLNAFLLGFWNELFNVSVLFSLIIITILIYFYKKDLINLQMQKNLLILAIPFLIGLINFFIFSDYFSGVTMANHSMNWLEIFKRINIMDFLINYWQYLIRDKIIFYLIILFCFFFLLIRKKENLNIIILMNIAIICGYLMTNLIFLIVRYEDFSYFFRLNYYQYLTANILEFSIIILLGCIYYEYKKCRTYMIVIFIILTIFLTHIFHSDNIKIQDIKLQNKLQMYRLEKIVIVYNTLGEVPIIYWWGNIMPDRIVYLQNEYKININKLLLKIRQEQEVEKEFNKRLKILDDNYESDEELKRNKVSFSNLNKYKGLKLTLKDIDKIKVTDDISDLLIKTKAYINYRDANYKEALKLYNKYLQTNKNDYDALKNIKIINLYYLNKEKLKKIGKIAKFNYLLNDTTKYIKYLKNEKTPKELYLYINTIIPLKEKINNIGKIPKFNSFLSDTEKYIKYLKNEKTSKDLYLYINTIIPLKEKINNIGIIPKFNSFLSDTEKYIMFNSYKYNNNKTKNSNLTHLQHKIEHIYDYYYRIQAELDEWYYDMRYEPSIEDKSLYLDLKEDLIEIKEHLVNIKIHLNHINKRVTSIDEMELLRIKEELLHINEDLINIYEETIELKESKIHAHHNNHNSKPMRN